MKKTLISLIIIFTCIATLRLQAQTLGDYTFNTGTDATKWIPLTGATNVCSIGDAGKSNILDIGFNFTFGENTYNKISINADGNIKFGEEQTGTSNCTVPFSSANANKNNPKINFLGCDGYMTDSGYVYVELTGIAPNRILVVEFATSTFVTASRASLLHWQVQLFESSNDIQVVYGSSAPTIPPKIKRQVGMCINDSDIILVDSNHQMNYYSAGQDTATIDTFTWPDANRYYSFTAPVVTCPRPYNLRALEIYSTNATLTWDPMGTETQWDIYYSTSGASPTISTTPTNQVSSPYCTLTNLNPSTTYHVFVRANCGNETSPWTSYSFVTCCPPITQLPFTEDFDSHAGSTSGSSNNLPDCWDYINMGTHATYIGYPIIYSTASYAYSFPNSLRFYTGTSTSYNYGNEYAILPPIDATLYPINTLQISFGARKHSTSNNYGFMLIVGIMEGSTESSFVPIDTITSTSTSYQNYTVYFNRYTGSGNRIALWAPKRNQSNTLYNAGNVDNIVVESMPSCPTPNDLAAISTSSNHVTLNWRENGHASSWIVEYGPAGFTPGTGVQEHAYTVPYSVTNLTPNLLYDFYVKSDCGDGDTSHYSDAVTALTTCVSISILPFVENFDNTTGSTSTSVSVNNLPNCWNFFNAGANTSYSGYPIVFANTEHAASGNNSMRFYTSEAAGTYSDQAAILPSVDITHPINTLQMSFKARQHSVSYPFTLVVGVMSNPSDMSTFIPIDTILPQGLNYRDYRVYFNDYTGTGNTIAIMAPQPSYGYNYGYVDDIVLEELPDCPAPGHLTVSNIDLTSVTLSWLEMGTASSWIVEYGPAGFIPNRNMGTEEIANSNPFTVSNLSPSLPYDFYVRSNCSTDTNYHYASLHYIYTLCGPITTLPFFIDFDGIPGSAYGTTNNLPACWHNISGTNSSYTGYPIVYSTSSFANSQPNSLRFYTGTSTIEDYGDQYAILPPFDESRCPITNLQVSFDMRKFTPSYQNFTLTVGVMTDPTDTSTFVPVTDVVATEASYETFTVKLDQYNGTGKYIALKAPHISPIHSAINAGNVDNILVEEIPTCFQVTNVMHQDSTLTATSADISWTAGGTELQWNVVYGVSGTISNPENENPQTVSIMPEITLTGLQGSTSYDVFIQSDCGAAVSPWTIYSFRTECTEITNLPFRENFDSYGTGSTAYPYCWSKSSTYSPAMNLPYIQASGADGSTGCLFFHGVPFHAGENNMAITPPFNEITTPINTLRASFKYKADAIGDRLIVGVISVPDNPLTFIPVDTIQAFSTSWTDVRVDFNTYTGSGKNIAFMSQSFNSTSSSRIDNLVIDLLSSCSGPYNMMVSQSTGNDVTILWSDDENIDSWELLISEEGTIPDTTTSVEVHSASYSFTELTPNTYYTVIIRTICPSGDHSDWKTIGFTTTSSIPAQTPYIQDFSNPTENVEWTLVNESESNKWHIGKPNLVADTVLYVSSNSTTTDYVGDDSRVWAYRDIQFGQGAEFNFSFDWRCAGENGQDFFRVYIGIPDTVVAGFGNAPAGAVQLGGNFNSHGTSWQHESFPLNSSYSNTIQRIYFSWQNNGSVNNSPAAIIDNIRIDISDCGRPDSVVVSNLTETSFDVSFIPATPTDLSWEYVVCPAGTNPNNMTPVSFSNTAFFSENNLTSGNTYQIYIRTVCSGGDYSEWSSPLEVSMPCTSIAQLPFSEDFDAYTGTSTGATNNLPSCWNYINTGTYAPYAGYPVLYNITSHAQSSPNCLRFYSSTSATEDYGDQYAILPPINVTLHPMNTMQISMDVRKYSSLYDSFTLIVGVMTNASEANTFIPVDTLEITSTSYQNFTVFFNNYTGAGNRIALKAPRQAHLNVICNSGNVDNIVVEPMPSCPKPTHFHMSSATQHDITISWTESGTANDWNIEYGPTGFTQGTGTITSTYGTSSITISGLSPSMTYDFYVQSDCGSGDVSDWSNKISGSTLCGAINQMPYTENFDATAISTLPTSNTAAEMPVCWNRINTYDSPRPFCYSVNAYAGGSLYFSATEGSYNLAIMPEIDASIPIQDLKVSFLYRGQSASNTTPLEVGIMSNPSDAASFVTIATVPFDSTVTNWVYREVNFSTYTGTGHHIAFRNGSTSETTYAYLDNLVVDYDTNSTPIIPCPVPTSLAITNITPTSATATWTADDANAWEIQYKLAASTDWGSIIPLTANTYHFTGLTANTQYQVRVRTNCIEGNVSEWSAEENFTTEQGVVPDPCLDPSNLTATNTTSSSVVLSWTENGTATAWTINYKPDDTNIWTTVSASENPFTLTGLFPGTGYSVYIVANCTNSQSGASNLTTFSTQGSGIEAHETSTTLHPNPTNGTLIIENAEFNINHVMIYDVYGKLLMNIEVNGNETSIDASTFANGMYFARIATEKGVVTKAFIKK